MISYDFILTFPDSNINCNIFSIASGLVICHISNESMNSTQLTSVDMMKTYSVKFIKSNET